MPSSTTTGERICYQHQFERVNVPVLHVSGWYDDEQIGTPLNFVGMTTHGATAEARASQRLLMGPWGHRSTRRRSSARWTLARRR